jgi:hypothetical protein
MIKKGKTFQTTMMEVALSVLLMIDDQMMKGGIYHGVGPISWAIAGSRYILDMNLDT